MDQKAHSCKKVTKAWKDAYTEETRRNEASKQIVAYVVQLDIFPCWVWKKKHHTISHMPKILKKKKKKKKKEVLFSSDLYIGF